MQDVRGAKLIEHDRTKRNWKQLSGVTDLVQLTQIFAKLENRVVGRHASELATFCLGDHRKFMEEIKRDDGG